MSRTAAEMVEVWTEAEYRKANPDQGDGYKKTSDSGGINVESFSLDEIRASIRYWQSQVLAQSAGGSIQLSTITVIPVGSNCDE